MIEQKTEMKKDLSLSKTVFIHLYHHSKFSFSVYCYRNIKHFKKKIIQFPLLEDKILGPVKCRNRGFELSPDKQL